MDKKTDKIIKNYISFAADQNKNFIKAYLFGSYAKQTDNPNSDIDIAMVIDRLDDNEKFDLQVELMLMASDFDLRIEPHLISNQDFNSQNPFANEIIKTGIEIKPIAV